MAKYLLINTWNKIKESKGEVQNLSVRHTILLAAGGTTMKLYVIKIMENIDTNAIDGVVVTANSSDEAKEMLFSGQLGIEPFPSMSYMILEIDLEKQDTGNVLSRSTQL